MSTRRLLALFAISLASLGVVQLLQDDRISAGILLRSALIIGAVWLAFPNIQRLNRSRLVVVVLVVGVAVTRPSLLIWLGPAFLAFFWLASSRHRRS